MNVDKGPFSEKRDNSSKRGKRKEKKNKGKREMQDLACPVLNLPDTPQHKMQ